MNVDYSSLTVVSAVLRRIKAVAIAAVATGLFGGIFALVISSGHTSSAGLILQDPEASLRSRPPTAEEERRYVKTQSALIRSEAVLEDAAAKLAAGDPPLQRRVEQLYADTHVRIDEDSNVVTVEAEASSGSQARAMVNAVVTAFTERVEADRDDAVSAAIGELDTRITAANERLAGLATTNQAVARTRIEELSNELSSLATANLTDEARQAAVQQIQTELNTWRLVAQSEESDPAVRAQQAETEQILTLLEELRVQRNDLEARAVVTAEAAVVTSRGLRSSPNGLSFPSAFLISTFLGLVGATGVAYVLETRRSPVKDRRLPERELGTALLAEVPELPHGREGAVVVGGVRLAGDDEIEPFRFLMADLEQLAGRTIGGTPVVMVVGLHVGDGASTVAGNLARAAGELGRRVLAVDTDGEHAALTEALTGSAEESPVTLTDVMRPDGTSLLEDLEPSQAFDGGGSVSVLSPGFKGRSSEGWFRPGDVEACFTDLARLYDLVVVDVPPVLDTPRSGIVLTDIATVVIVVKDGTSETDLAAARARLDVLGAPPAGYVYNHTPDSAGAWR